MKRRPSEGHLSSLVQGSWEKAGLFFLIWREFCFIMGFPSGTVVKNLPAVQETWVRSLSLEDLLEKGMSTHSSIPARKVPWTEEPDVL